MAFSTASGGLRPSLFEKDRFFEIRNGDTFYSTLAPEHYDPLRRKYDQASWIGDKSPPVVYLLDHIESRFDGAHVVVIVRDAVSVASSYQARSQDETDASWASDRDYRLAVKEWNDANRLILDFINIAGRKTGVTVVSYDEIFLGNVSISPLFEALGLSDRPVRRAYSRTAALAKTLSKARRNILTVEQTEYVEMNADLLVHEKLLAHRLVLPTVSKFNCFLFR